MDALRMGLSASTLHSGTDGEKTEARRLYGIGIPQELFTATFAAARMGGWMAYALEQKQDNRLVRPIPATTATPHECGLQSGSEQSNFLSS